MIERWQQVGEQLGLKLPEHVGRLVLPLFSGERGGQTVVRNDLGLAVGRLINRSGHNEAGLRDVVLATASTRWDGWVVAETHRPRPLPESSYGPVVCPIVDFGSDKIRVQNAPRGPAPMELPAERSDDDLEQSIQANALAQLCPLAAGEGVDIFHPAAADLVQGPLRALFTGHQFSAPLGQAMAKHFGLPEC